MQILDKIVPSKRKRQKLLANLSNVSSKPAVVQELTALQNEIAVGFSTKVIAVSSLRDDALASAFAKGLADTFAINGEKTLVIDANLYNPSLSDVLGQQRGEGIVKLGDNVDAVMMEKQTYPSEVYKSGAIEEIVKAHESEYAHFVILVPNLRDHKEIALLKGFMTALILVTQRNVTAKQWIYEACAYCAEAELPFAKAVVLK